MAKQAPKITIDELQQKEEPELIEKIYFWLVHNRDRLLTVLVIFVVVFAVVGVIGQRSENRRIAASDQLFHALELYESALQGEQWGTPGRTAKMNEVRQAADDIISKYPGTPAARNALFLKGNAFYFEGEPIGQSARTEQAITYFQEYLASLGSRDHFERAAAQLALGYAHENLYLLAGNDPARSLDALNNAARIYEGLIADENAGFLRHEAMLAKARLHVAQEEPEQARPLLERVLRERGEFPAEPAENASESARVMFAIQELAGQFSTANTARIQLMRLGVDTEALVEELRAQ